MNARAAWRLERLGFSAVYRYAAGKVDWLAAGFPTEGRRATTIRAGDVARRDAPTCGPDERVAAAATRLREAGVDGCVVVNEERVVLGRLRGSDLDESSDALVEDVMQEGPTTVRPSEELRPLADRLRERGVASIVVTDPEGRLIGTLRRDDAEARLGATAPGR